MKLALQDDVQPVFFTHAHEVIFSTAGEEHFKPLQIFEPV
jgi:hypothetical protein